MKIDVSYDMGGVCWEELAGLLRRAGMGSYAPLKHKKAFGNSFRTVFLFDGKKLVGCGRLLSDEAYQGAIYDVAVEGEYRGKGLGKKIVEALLEGTEDLNILLYASPGKELFYEKLGFFRMKTGMARFKDAQAMKEKGFL